MLAHSPQDNVTVAVGEGLSAETAAFGVVTEDNATVDGHVHHDVPIGHKVALTELKVGDTVIKYGQDIGKVVKDVDKGVADKEKELLSV